MGATDFINPTQLPEGKTIVDVLVEKTDGGCEHTLCVELSLKRSYPAHRCTAPQAVDVELTFPLAPPPLP